MNAFVPAEVTVLEPWVRAGLLGPSEVHGAAALVRIGRDTPAPDVLLAAALAMWAPRNGHACIDVTTVITLVEHERAVTAVDRSVDVPPAGTPPADVMLPWPPVAALLDRLAISALVRVVGRRDTEPVYDDRPLILHGTLLYTQRQWIDECVVAEHLLVRMAGATDNGSDASTIEPAVLGFLDALLAPERAGVETSQHRAAVAAMSQPLTVIVGGPGTGKTHVLACLLAALSAWSPVGGPLRIGLAAPTGKAAALLTEAIASATESLGGGRPAPLEASTLHRLLGPRPDTRTRFEFGTENAAPYDLVVVDESSMVSLAMMARLVEALTPSCRLVLVGDPDQLASIDAGHVLGDIVAAAPPGCVFRLDRQHRTSAGSPIADLAAAIREQRPDDVVRMLREPSRGRGGRSGKSGKSGEAVTFIETSGDISEVDELLVRDFTIDALRAICDPAVAGDAGAALTALARLRVLCAHRRGPFGVGRWNDLIETWMFGEGDRGDVPGRVLLATRNDARTGINNGDTGVLVGTGTGVMAAFPRPGEPRQFGLAQLADVETAFAMTIHKSQGSQYDDVVVIHPPEGSPLLARALLYTAVTRARRRLVIVGTTVSIVAAVNTPTTRVTGLADALRSGRGPA